MYVHIFICCYHEMGSMVLLQGIAAQGHIDTYRKCIESIS